jgi:hypothetical protein
MADNEQRTAGTPATPGAGGTPGATGTGGQPGTPAGSSQAAPSKGSGDDGDELGADVPRAPAGTQDPPTDPAEPMNPA